MIKFPVLLDCAHTARPDTPHLRGICEDCNRKLEDWLVDMLLRHEGLKARRDPIRVGPSDSELYGEWDTPKLGPRQ